MFMCQVPGKSVLHAGNRGTSIGSYAFVAYWVLDISP